MLRYIIMKKRQSYPFGQMDRKDFFHVPYTGDPVVDDQIQNTVRAATWQYGRRHGLKFESSSIKHKGVDGLKILRVK